MRSIFFMIITRDTQLTQESELWSAVRKNKLLEHLPEY